MTLRPIPGSPPGAPNPPFPSGRKRPAIIRLPDTMTIDSISPAGHAKWQAEARHRARQNIAFLRAKRTLRVPTDLYELERDEAWLREQLEHDKDDDLFDFWCARLAAAMPEFTLEEAKMVAMYVPVAPIDKDAPPWLDTLVDSLAALANKRGASDGYAFSEEGRALLVSAAAKYHQIPGSRITTMEQIVLGTRIGSEPRFARRKMQP